MNRRDPTASAVVLPIAATNQESESSTSSPATTKDGPKSSWSGFCCGDLAVFHRQKQPQRKHPCENGGGCDHICITMYQPNGQPYAQCACAPGYRLASRSLCTPIEHASFLIYANRMIKGVPMSNMTPSLQRNGNRDVIVPILEVKPPFSLDYNVKEQLIYFGQNEL